MFPLTQVRYRATGRRLGHCLGLIVTRVGTNVIPPPSNQEYPVRARQIDREARQTVLIAGPKFGDSVRKNDCIEMAAQRRGGQSLGSPHR